MAEHHTEIEALKNRADTSDERVAKLEREVADLKRELAELKKRVPSPGGVSHH